VSINQYLINYKIKLTLKFQTQETDLGSEPWNRIHWLLKTRSCSILSISVLQKVKYLRRPMERSDSLPDLPYSPSLIPQRTIFFLFNCFFMDSFVFLSNMFMSKFVGWNKCTSIRIILSLNIVIRICVGGIKFILCECH